MVYYRNFFAYKYRETLGRLTSTSIVVRKQVQKHKFKYNLTGNEPQ